MVGVFVRDEDGGQFRRGVTDGFEAFADVKIGDSGVHEDRGPAGGKEKAVAAAAAVEDANLHSLSTMIIALWHLLLLLTFLLRLCHNTSVVRRGFAAPDNELATPR